MLSLVGWGTTNSQDDPRLWACCALGAQSKEKSNPLEKTEGGKASWKTPWKRFRLSRVEEWVIRRLREVGRTTVRRLRGCETGRGNH